HTDRSHRKASPSQRTINPVGRQALPDKFNFHFRTQPKVQFPNSLPTGVTRGANPRLDFPNGYFPLQPCSVPIALPSFSSEGRERSGNSFFAGRASRGHNR